MELRHLRYFIAVAEERHVTRAAERLGMQQPPLSQQIRALERELDVQLFRRKPRGVELTDAGSALLADARAILSHIDHAFATTRRTARGEQGQIAVGFTSSAPFHPFVPRIIRAYREASPLVSLTLEESGTTELIDDLRNERIDAAFIRTRDRRSGRACRQSAAAGGDGAGPAARHSSPGGKPNKALPLKALADETFIVYRRHNGPGLYDAILSACHAAGFQPARRTGSAADCVDAESRRRRPWNFPRSRVVATHADGRRRVPPRGRRRTAEGAALSRIAAWRDVRGRAEFLGLVRRTAQNA